LSYFYIFSRILAAISAPFAHVALALENPMKNVLTICALSALSTSLFAATIRVSEATGGVQSNGASLSIRMSDDGRFAAFNAATTSTNLCPNDTNGVGDIVVKDLQNDTLVCASTDTAGAVGSASSSAPAISGDGRYVAFSSASTNLVPGANPGGTTQIYLKDTQTGAIEIISRATGANGAVGGGTSGGARVSTDGNFVAFASTSTNLVTGDTNGNADIFVRDRRLNETTRISVTPAGAQATGGGSTALAMSGDGRYFVIASSSQTLTTPADPNNLIDCFTLDRGPAPFTGTPTIARVTTTAGTTGACDTVAISKDGSTIAMSSTFTDLVANDTNAVRDVFYRAFTGTTLSRVTRLGGIQTTGASDFPSLNATGTRLGFDSADSAIIAGDTNGASDVFVLTINDGSLERVSVSTAGAEASGGGSTVPFLVPNTNGVAFSSNATNLVANDTNALTDVFLNQGAPVNTDNIFANGFE
jgi:TolB protein